MSPEDPPTIGLSRERDARRVEVSDVRTFEQVSAAVAVVNALRGALRFTPERVDFEPETAPWGDPRLHAYVPGATVRPVLEAMDQLDRALGYKR